MERKKVSISVTIDNEINNKLEEIVSETLAGKSAIVNDVLKKFFQSETDKGIKT